MKTMYIITVEFEGKTYKPVTRMSKKAVSNFANATYSKYYRKYGERADESLTVRFGYFNDNMDWVPCGTYHA